MKQLFRKYDANKDRRLDHGELRGALTLSHFFGRLLHVGPLQVAVGLPGSL